MSNQLPKPKGLWERKTFASAGMSALLAASVAVSVCAVRGDLLATGQPTPVRVSVVPLVSSMGQTGA